MDSVNKKQDPANRQGIFIEVCSEYIKYFWNLAHDLRDVEQDTRVDLATVQQRLDTAKASGNKEKIQQLRRKKTSS
jgi:hypothetical protein